MCEEKHKKTRGTVIWVRERQDRKRWWQHSKKENVGQNKKKKDEREETRERKSQKTRIIYSDKDMKWGEREGGYGNETDSLKMTPKPQNRKKNSSEVSANQTDSMTGRWKELNDVRMRAKRSRRWQKDGRGGHRVERVRKEGKWLAGKKTDGGERERDRWGGVTLHNVQLDRFKRLISATGALLS